tara:strand:- start:1062 stop:2468 length:1407 start_codon:yes stop_codon:yes gene_type:complete
MTESIAIETDLARVNEIVTLQSSSTASNLISSYQQRIDILKKLSRAITTHSEAIAAALLEDLGKSKLEAQIAEIGFVQGEIAHSLKHLKKWMKPKRVSSPLILLPARSFIVSNPLGKVLIISPWNYPFQLLFSPLVGALAAGNQVILKPSELAPATANVITRIVQETFDPRLVNVVNGGVEQTTKLLEQRFDHIFYTGNGHVGRIVMEKAAKHLTPVTLELGGKSPCVVAGLTNLEVAARRIAWGKWFNAGQTCVAPDYVLVEKGLKDKLLNELNKVVKEFYGDNAATSPDYGKIVNQRHFNRLINLFKKDDIIFGGESDESKCYLAPTVISADFDHPIMQQEIFGPILPIIETDSFDNALKVISRRDHPLAAYLFSDDAKMLERFSCEVQAGGICLNDCLMHLSNPDLPFGGVGESGMGSYHGHTSFKIFSHQKSVLKRFFIFDLKLRYPPYSGKLAPLAWLLKWFG